MGSGRLTEYSTKDVDKKSRFRCDLREISSSAMSEGTVHEKKGRSNF